jgi:hypothetical protein
MHPERITHPYTEPVEKERPYYFRESALEGVNEDFEGQLTMQRYTDVLRTINPNVESVWRRQAVDHVVDLLNAHVDNLVDAGRSSGYNRRSMHPSFERMRTQDGNMDLPIDAYIEGGKRLRQNLLAEYERTGAEMPAELLELLHLSDSESGEEN